MAHIERITVDVAPNGGGWVLAVSEVAALIWAVPVDLWLKLGNAILAGKYLRIRVGQVGAFPDVGIGIRVKALLLTAPQSIKA